MDALLGSQQQRGNHVCGSVDDLQAQLHNFLLSKVSETRAEHASLTFELRYNTVFYLPPAESENGRSESAAGSAQSQQPQQPPSSEQQQQEQEQEQSQPQPQPTRTVTASETIQNQPSDDPALQKDVAKHIMERIALVDNSTWNVRSVARASQGWTFTYLCKDSHQAWSRTNAKKPERPVIGLFSGYGGLDPINLSRPAFDCRGTLSIAFSKTHRGVIVKYDHTLLHKTVGQLVELLAPPTPVPVPVVAGSTRTPKAKRPPPAEGEEGSRKKRQKRKSKAAAPEAPMKVPPAQDAANVEASQDNAAQASSLLNVPPLEAARRKETAISLLTGKGIDPATLSAEQFNIFANQAPQLQEASLEMLAKYGAEKLRIVHPEDKDQTGSANSTPAQAPSSTVTPTPASVTATPTVETPTKGRRRGKKKAGPAAGELSIGDGAVVSLEHNGEVGTTSSTLKLQAKGKKTRGACETCKQKKLKCTKEHPACSICRNSGDQCVYAPPKPGRKSEKFIEAAEPDDTQRPSQHGTESSIPVQQLVEVQVDEPPPAPPPQSAAAPIQSQPPAPMEDPENDEFIPDPNILSGPVDSQSHPATTEQQPLDNYYHHGVTFPTTHQSNPDRNLPTSGLTFPPPPPAHGQPAYSQPAPAPPVAHDNQQRPAASSRRSLPTAQPKQSPVPPPAVVSPTMQQAASRHRPRKSAPEGPHQLLDGLQQAASMSQAALQTQNQRSPAMTVRSPYQNAAAIARTKSRQSHRSQTNTPVSNASLSQPPAAQQTASHQSVTAPSYSANSTSTSNSIPNYDPYARYNNTEHSSRITYEPGTYHNNIAVTTSASYSATPSYDYTRTTAPASAASSNPLSQALNNGSGGYGDSNAASSPWQAAQARSTQPQPSHYSSHSHNHGYNNSPEQQRAQPYSYSSSHQQPNTTQPSQQNWYGGFNGANANSNNSSSNRNAAYGGAPTTTTAATPYQNQNHRPNLPGYASHSYGSTDEQSIYDLLRASGSGN